MTRVLVIGASGHAKVVADILLCQGIDVLGFLDDNPTLWGSTRLGLPVLGGIDGYREYDADGLAMGIGDNATRKRIVERLGATREMWCNAIHPSSVIGRSVGLGRGLVIAAMAVVNSDTIIGDYAIVNTSASIDHDCFIAEYAHVAPGVHLSGAVHVGIGALLGVGSCVAPLRRVEEWAVVGAGASVVRDVPARVVAKGVPARWNNK